MQIRLYNSTTQDGITIRFTRTTNQYFISSFMIASGLDARFRLSQTVGGTETILGYGAVNYDDYKLTSLRIDSGSLALYIAGEVRWQGAITPITVDMLEMSGDTQTSLIDELVALPRAATDAELRAWYESTRPLGDQYVPLGTFWSLDWDSPDDTLEVQVRARDRMELLRNSTYQPGAVVQSESLYALAEHVLQDAGLEAEAYQIDTDLQSIIIPWAWLPPTYHREALRIIAEAGLAVVYADRDGVVRVESLTGGSGETVLEITKDDYYPPLNAPSRQDQVANEIVVTTQPLRPATTAEEVYRSNTPITIPAGQTVTVTARYNQPPVIDAMASLDSPPAGVSITGATYYAWGAEVRIRNTGASSADVILVITGKSLTVRGGEQVIRRDEASITENGVLRYEFPANPLVQTLAQAQAIAETILASAKDPRRDIEVEWRGNPALELGDRVKVVGQDVSVIRQNVTWAGYLSSRLTGRKVTL